MGNSDHRFRRVGCYSKVIIQAPTKADGYLSPTPQHDEVFTAIAETARREGGHAPPLFFLRDCRRNAGAL